MAKYTSDDTWDQFWSGDPDARIQILLDHLPLVKAIAYRVGRHIHFAEESEDLVQWGCEGLIESLNRFDPSNGAPFRSFAAMRIEGSMIDAMRREDFLTRRARRKVNLVRSTEDRLAQDLLCEPTPHDVADVTDLTVEEVVEAREMDLVDRFYSLDHVLKDESTNDTMTSGDTVIDVAAQDEFDEVDERLALRQAVEKISEERLRLIFELVYDFGLNYREIAKALDLDYQKVYWHSRKLVRAMQEAMAA